MEASASAMETATESAAAVEATTAESGTAPVEASAKAAAAPDSRTDADMIATAVPRMHATARVSLSAAIS